MGADLTACYAKWLAKEKARLGSRYGRCSTALCEILSSQEAPRSLPGVCGHAEGVLASTEQHIASEGACRLSERLLRRASAWRVMAETAMALANARQQADILSALSPSTPIDQAIDGIRESIHG